MRAVSQMPHRTHREDDFHVGTGLLQQLQGGIPLRHNLFHIQTHPLELVVRDFVAVGDNQVAGDVLVAERRAERDEEIAGSTQEIRTALQIFVNIGLEFLEILFGKTTVVREAHP